MLSLASPVVSSADISQRGDRAGASPPPGAEANPPTGHTAREGASGARAASPRKRHRHTPRPSRPCLDFEKMQQVIFLFSNLCTFLIYLNSSIIYFF